MLSLGACFSRLAVPHMIVGEINIHPFIVMLIACTFSQIHTYILNIHMYIM